MKAKYIFIMLLGATLTMACGSDEDEVTPNTPATPSTPTDPVAAEVIDLGLSVKWCGYNVGAKSPEDAHQFSTLYPIMINNNSRPASDYKWWGDSRYDYATKAKGSKWRTPTEDEWQELVDECIWEWGKYKDVQGYYVSNRNKTAKMFLPAPGSSKDGFDFSMYCIASYNVVWYMDELDEMARTFDELCKSGATSHELEDYRSRMANKLKYPGFNSFFFVAQGVHGGYETQPYAGAGWTNPSTRKTYTFTGSGQPVVQCCRAVCQ